MKQPNHLWLNLLLLVPLLFTACVPVAQEAQTETTSETTEAAADAATTSAATRTITHALGETEITGTPERVVTLEWSYTEDLLALGMQPAGVADIDGYHSWVKIGVALADDVIDVGTRQEPNLETLTQLGPDLIIAPAFRIADTYDELSAIAPTVAFDVYPTDEETTQFTAVKDAFMTIADIVGRTAEGAAVLADMEAHFAAARAQVEAAGMAGEPFILAQAFGQDTVSIRLFTDNAMGVEIVEQIGLENGWSDEEFQLYGFTTVGMETLPDLGNVNFFYVVQDENNVFQRESILPLWESIDFVQNGNAYPLGGDTWLFGGPLSAKVLVDIVVEALTGEAVTVAMESADQSAAAAESCDAGHRLFTHDEIVGGSLCVPENAERVVTLSPFYALQMAVKLDLPVIGTALYGEDGPFPSALSAEETAAIELIGAFEEPNLETITELAPDVIIGDAYYHGESLDLLSQIAPTVLIATPNWKEWYRIIADVGGATEKANAELAAYDARVAEIRKNLRDIEVSFVRAVPGGFQLYRAAPNAYAPIAVMSEAGVVRPEFENGTAENSWERLDWEGIVNLTGDVLFYVAAGANDADGAAGLVDEITANPIWQQLPAVQAGEAYRVNPDHWMNFGGLHSAHAVLDDLEKYLTQ